MEIEDIDLSPYCISEVLRKHAKRSQVTAWMDPYYVMYAQGPQNSDTEPNPTVDGRLFFNKSIQTKED
jgi:hypothetical protein